MNQNLHFYILVFLFSFFCINCEKEKCLNCPEDLEPGRRDYIWTVDTLKANPWDLFYLFSLWGSSPTDIWATGSGGASDVTLWHYDGVSWTRDLSCLSSNMMCVFGFAQNDVWACDAPGRGVYHFNGTQWSVAYTYEDAGLTRLGLDDIWGNSPDNIYAVGSIDSITGGGYKCVIMHYDGSTWKFVPIPDYKVGLNRIRRGVRESNKYYISGTRFENTGNTAKAFELDGNSLKEIYSGKKGINVSEINGRLYFTQAGGKQILTYTSSDFQVWKDFSSTDITLGLLWGRNEMDIFTQAFKAGLYGVGHYNGTDWVLLYQMTEPISDLLLFEKDLFILYDNNVIVHGKLP